MQTIRAILVIVVVSTFCYSVPALAQSCSQDIYAIELRDEGPVAKKVRIHAEAQAKGGYKAVADMNEQNRKQAIVDSDLPAEQKAKLIGWLDWNIRTARCWAAVAK